MGQTPLLDSLEDYLSRLAMHAHRTSTPHSGENSPASSTTPDFSRIHDMIHRLDLPSAPPYPGARTVIVAGTNGKGSTVAALESLAFHHGLQVASFTSPHVQAFNERIRIQRTPVPDWTLLRAFQSIHQCQAMSGLPIVELSFFEYAFLAARWIFHAYHTASSEPLDVIIWEVGIGGLHDVVNTLDGDVGIVTSISHDHCELLGPTLEDIARQKAGIFRARQKVFLAPGLPNLLYTQASKAGAHVEIVSEEVLPRKCSLHIKKTNAALAYRTFESLFPEYVFLRKRYRVKRTLAAFQDIQQLGRQEPFILTTQKPIHDSPDLKDHADSNAPIPIHGLLDVAHHAESIAEIPIHGLLDVAHNAESIAYLAQSLPKCLKNTGTRKVILVFCCQQSKWSKDLLKPLLPFVNSVHTAPLEGVSTLSASDLRTQLSPKIHVTEHASIETILALMHHAQDSKNLWVITGSFYWVGAFRKRLMVT